MKKIATTEIRVLDETWHVPRGFGATYRRVIKDHFASGEQDSVSGTIDLLALIGYHVTPEQVADWDLRRRIEAVIYAATEHARASDNPVQRHPLPTWLPAQPWQGSASGEGAFAGPGGTPVP